MSSHSIPSHQSFDRRVTTVKGEPSRGPYKRSLTNPNNHSNANSFLTYVKLHLEDIIIERYRYGICGSSSAFRSVVQVTRYIVMHSHNTIMGTCISNRIFLAFHAEKKKYFEELISCIKQKLRTSYSVVLVREGLEEEVSAAILSYLINFTLVCRILESGKWIHIGDNMETLVESKFMTLNDNNNNSNAQNINNNEQSKRNSYFNCMGFNSKIENYSMEKTKNKNAATYSVQLYIRIFLQYFKILPLEEKDAEIDMHVYCLPRCAMPASLSSIIDAKFDKRFNYKDYWFDIHGYVLTQAATQKIANVHLYVQQFNYPLGALLREAPMKLLRQLEKVHMYDILHLFRKCEVLKNTHFNSIIFFLPESENNRFKEVDKDFFMINNWNYDSDISDETFKEEVQNMYAYDFMKNEACQMKKVYLVNTEKEKSKNEKEKKEAENEKGKYISTITLPLNTKYSNSKENANSNAYSSYNNTISNCQQSINLNFSKGISNSTESNAFYGTKKNNQNVDDFLKNTALNYKISMLDAAEQKNQHIESNSMNKETHGDMHKENNSNTDNYESIKNTTKNNDYEKSKYANAKIDSFLSAVTAKYKISKHVNKKMKSDEEREAQNKKTECSDDKENTNDNDQDDFFGSINEKILFSKDFQIFLNNINTDEDISAVTDKLNLTDFNEREQKRPNFPVNEKMNMDAIKEDKGKQNDEYTKNEVSEKGIKECSLEEIKDVSFSKDNDDINKRKIGIQLEKENNKKQKNM